MTATSFDKNRIRILLLEGVHSCAVDRLAADGYASVTRLDHALQGEDLISAMVDIHMLGTSRFRASHRLTFQNQSGVQDARLVVAHRHLISIQRCHLLLPLFAIPSRKAMNGR